VVCGALDVDGSPSECVPKFAYVVARLSCGPHGETGFRLRFIPHQARHTPRSRCRRTGAVRFSCFGRAVVGVGAGAVSRREAIAQVFLGQGLRRLWAAEALSFGRGVSLECGVSRREIKRRAASTSSPEDLDRTAELPARSPLRCWPEPFAARDSALQAHAAAGREVGARAQSLISTLSIESPCAIASTTSWPSRTWPKTPCLPSRWGVATWVMKNWDPLVLGPALAIDSRPGAS